MIIKNQSRAGNIKFGYYLTTFLYLAAVVLGLYFEIPNLKLTLGLLTLVFLLGLIFSFQLRFNHLIFMDTGDKLILRYYPLHPFHEKFKSIEIPKSEFSHFEIKKGLFNLRTEVILFQQTVRGVAKYPPVSISALTKKDRENFLASLLLHAATKKM